MRHRGVSTTPGARFSRLAGVRVLVTGDTGFKGAWLSRMLTLLGADVIGLGLMPTDPSLFKMMAMDELLTHHTVDIRDPCATRKAVHAASPEFIIHMAAQALVRRSYVDPEGTFATNVMGTFYVLEAAASLPTPPRATLVVTSDKVYRNDNHGVPFTEDMPLGGNDPYSASKVACEQVVSAFRSSRPHIGPLGSARAGNVVGGGDWAEDRLIPDFYRALSRNERIVLRYPDAVRPWQHVLDVLDGYLLLLLEMESGKKAAIDSMNFGPDATSQVPTVKELVESLGEAMLGRSDVWSYDTGAYPPEHMLLRLDTTLARDRLGWRARLDHAMTIGWIAEWYQKYRSGKDPRDLVDEQIIRYLEMT